MNDHNLSTAKLLDNWANYHKLLVAAIEPLSVEQLALKPAPHLRSVGENMAHIARTHGGWFLYDLKEGDDNAEFKAIAEWPWDATTASPHTAAELVQALGVTWAVLRDRFTRWTPEQMAEPIPTEDNDGTPITITRQWVLWHLIEHDLHHGGEISFTLGMHGLTAPDI